MLIFLFLLVFTRTVYALDYFDFNSVNYLIPKDKIVNLAVDFNLKGYTPQDFLIRPVIESGSVQIYNTENESWVSAFDLWTSMPFLSHTMKIKITTSAPDNLNFLVLNLVTGEVYKTNLKKYYPYHILLDLFSKIKLY